MFQQVLVSRRSLLVAFLLVGLLSAGLLSPVLSPHAHAATPILSCTGTSHTTYSPGIVTSPPRKVHLTFTSTLAPCTTTDPTITSGTSSLEADVTATCLEVTSFSGSFLIQWNNGETSETTTTIQESVVLPTGDIQVIAQGFVTDGFGTGDSFTTTTTFLSSDLTACSTSQGLTTLTGERTLQFF